MRVFRAGWIAARGSFGVATIVIEASRYSCQRRRNSYQATEPNTAYTYLVNDHQSPDAEIHVLNLADETAANGLAGAEQAIPIGFKGRRPADTDTLAGAT